MTSLTNIPTKEDIIHQVGVLKDLRSKSGVLKSIRECVNSCIEWDENVSKFLTDVRQIYNKGPENPTTDSQSLRNAERRIARVTRDVVEEIREERTVLIEVLLPDLSNHAFAIEPKNNGNEARVVHSWRDKYQLRERSTMLVEKLGDHLKSLTSLDIQKDASRLSEILRILWGQDHVGAVKMAKPLNGKIKFMLVLSGRCADRQCMADVMKTWDALNSLSPSDKAMDTYGAGLGFVFGAAGVLSEDSSSEDGVDWNGVFKESGKGSIASGVGGVAQTVVIKSARSVLPKFSRVVRTNAAVGTAAATVFVIWDLVEWKRNEISTVEFRKRQAKSLAGTAGGIAGGIAAGFAAGAVTANPLGVVIGGIIGGVAGAIGGTFAGQALDTVLWDASEDAIVESYEFFGWNESRNTHPTKSPKDVGTAYEEKLKNKPSGKKEDEWKLIVIRNMTVLLNAMYPDNKEMLELAASMRAKKSVGLSAIATNVCNQAC